MGWTQASATTRGGQAGGFSRTARTSRGLRLSLPEEIVERPGQGVDCRVDGRRVTVGSASWLGERGIVATPVAASPGRAVVNVAIDGRSAGAVVMADRVRDDARAAIAALHAGGVREVAMATGDRREVADAVAASVGVDRVYAELAPEDKLALVRDAA